MVNTAFSHTRWAGRFLGRIRDETITTQPAELSALDRQACDKRKNAVDLP
jgi:hypothetical protein